MGIATLIILLTIEVFFLIWSIISKDSHREEKSIVRISELILLGILLFSGIFEFGFRYIMILVVLIIQSMKGIIILKRKSENPYKLSRSIVTFVSNGFIYTFALFLAILCPQYKQPVPTGIYEISTAKYTWVDESRLEEYSDKGGNRALTVDFWYPENASGKYPLVVFSHGAFGFSGSNYSTFAELASNGYVVASISHPYHSFFTMDTNKELTIVNFDFINTVMENNNIDNEEKEFADSREWMALRVADENFALDTIISNANSGNPEGLFSIIDVEKIGLMGHSLGGASSSQLGRERNDIDAVINLDGTMLGERIAFENGALVLNNTSFPVPLLDIYAEDHYNKALELVGDEYVNFYVHRNAVCSYEVVLKDAGHLNFTDLPMFSPALAKMLGVGTVDERYCINKTNELVLKFFNCYLKDGPIPEFEKEY